MVRKPIDPRFQTQTEIGHFAGRYVGPACNL